MLVTIKHLHVQYGKQVALNIEKPIEFEQGERIGIIGSNGAGKTTFVKSILGLTDYKGSINTQLQPEEMAVHMQQNNYVSTMSVKHIMETLLCTKIKKNKQLQDLISFFDFEGCLKKKFSALSGGQKQRLTIIMVMIQDAPLTFFDEVTSGLDFETRQKLMEKLVQWYENKKTTLCVVSHYYEELEQLVDKILILEKGKVVAFGGKEELFHTYCGNAIITVDNNVKNEQLTAVFPKLKAPNHLIALSCKDREIEGEITSLLIQNDINFKRSNNDIEIMSINAKESFYEKGEVRHEG
ncbi:ATP-binding cassette domain-containing protein [Bacillus massiliigorillae]|uniref:ATP-binding cassette domain-containing protein n=1 Tax=Bacillus massiliigorillae TaxID=1243664 RepID=UPI0003A43B25|nr:ABC transporter ATP-binding protein [Bacillus massiliigorillae]